MFLSHLCLSVRWHYSEHVLFSVEYMPPYPLQRHYQRTWLQIFFYSFDSSQPLMSLMIESPMIINTSLFFAFLLLLLMLIFLFESVIIFFLLCVFKLIISCLRMLSLLCLRLNFSEFSRIFEWGKCHRYCL